MAFKNKAGAVALPTLTDAGEVPVAISAEAAGDESPELLRRLVWELHELRRVFCKDTSQTFKEYPG